MPLSNRPTTDVNTSRRRSSGVDAKIVATEEAAEPKSADAYKIERLTWFGLVGALVVTGVLPDWLSLHNGVTPLAAGLVLILSSIFQYRRKHQGRYSGWVAGTLLLALACFSYFSRPDLDVSLLVVVIVVIVIALGVFTRESL